MEKNQRNPRKRLNSLILLVAFTAVMLIVSTYAWFTSQKTVTVANLEGKVNVAEGIEISLDAKTWSQEIDFSDYANATAGVGQYTGLTQLYGEKVHNNTPTELIPVSTTGTETVANTTTEGNEVAFFNGTAAANGDSTKLSKILGVDPTQTSSAAEGFAGYYAIDLFLRNSSKLSLGADGKTGGEGVNADEIQGTAKETLQLNTNSNLQLVTGGNTQTGLQNTVRVALALYTPSSTADVAISQEGTSEEVQAKIIGATTGSGKAIEDVAIWEPNADQHVSEIVTNNNKIKWTTADAALYLTAGNNVDDDVDLENGADRIVGSSNEAKFLANEILPTYALLAASKTKDIADVYDWDGTNETYLKKQIALQTKKSAGDYTTVDGGVRNLISSKTSTGEDIYEYGYGSLTTDVKEGLTAETGAKEFQIYKNQISRVRMYIWLEGQDIDCTNYASHGAGIHIDLGLVKGAKLGGVADS